MNVSFWLALVFLVVIVLLWWAYNHKVVVPAPKPTLMDDITIKDAKRSWTYSEIVGIQNSLAKEKENLFRSKDAELKEAIEIYEAKFEEAKDFKPKITVLKKHYVPWIKYGETEFPAPYVMEMNVPYHGLPPSVGYKSVYGYDDWGSRNYFDPTGYSSDCYGRQKDDPWKGTKEELEDAIRSYFKSPVIEESTDAEILLVTLTGTKIHIRVPEYHLEAVYCDLMKKWQEYR